jgi:hypothetical protein
MPSPIAASAVPASGKAAAAAKAKPTMSFRSILRFLLFRDAWRRLSEPAKGRRSPDVLSDVVSPNPEGDRRGDENRTPAISKYGYSRKEGLGRSLNLGKLEAFLAFANSRRNGNPIHMRK